MALLLVVLLVAAPVAGQDPGGHIRPSSWPEETRPHLPSLNDWQDDGSFRSPLLAGLLSWWVVPGLGSYYAGNGAHGTRHLLIAVGSLSAAVLLITTCADAEHCGLLSDSPRGTAAVLLASTYLVNLAWSVITAVHDAYEYNDRARRFGLGIAPAIVAMPRHTFARPRTGLRLVRFTF